MASVWWEEWAFMWDMARWREGLGGGVWFGLWEGVGFGVEEGFEGEGIVLIARIGARNSVLKS